MRFWNALTPPGKVLVGFLVLVALLALAPLCAPAKACSQGTCAYYCVRGHCALPCVCVRSMDGEGICVRGPDEH